MYEYVLYQQQQQNYYNPYNYKPVPMTVTEKPNLNNNMFPPQVQQTMASMMPMPSQMMRPQQLDSNNSNNGMNFLGFQMNPVSKNRKK
jgi:hypothetical protein